jgi:hypothetical protein
VNKKTVLAFSFGLALEALLSMGCDSGWVGPTEEPGPLPLSSTNAPITRWIKTDETFEVTLRQVLWDEGSGPVPIEQRLNPLVNAVPQELMDQLHSTRKVPRQNGNGTYDQYIYNSWGTVVSVNPDVLIVTVREEPVGSYEWQFQDWFISDVTSIRGQYINQRSEHFNYICHSEIPISAGTLVPWSTNMYVVSTDSKIEYGRLKFENNQATIVLSDGKLVFRHHDDDVDVTRE